MAKSVRNTMCVAGSLLLLSAMTMSQTAAKSSDKDKTKQPPQKQQHLAASPKLHSGVITRTSKNATKVKVTPASSNPSKAKTAQVKPVSAKGATNKSQSRRSQPARQACHQKGACREQGKVATNQGFRRCSVKAIGSPRIRQLKRSVFPIILVAMAIAKKQVRVAFFIVLMVPAVLVGQMPNTNSGGAWSYSVFLQA